MKLHARSAPLLMAFLLAPLSGCITISTAQYQGVTSGLIGCPAEEILITNPQQGQITNWEARCRGVQYYCTAVAKHLSCKEALPAAPGAAPQQQP